MLAAGVESKHTEPTSIENSNSLGRRFLFEEDTMSDEATMATYGRLEYLHPNNSFTTEPLSDAYNLITFGR